MRDHRYRAWVRGKLVMVQAIFWDRKISKITEIRYLDESNEAIAVKEDDLKDVVLMTSTGIKETGKETFVFESDIVEIEYQRGYSTCVVEWCHIKSSLVLRPISGDSPKNQKHYRLSGKKSIRVIGNIFSKEGHEL